jgi:hypothetical protein
VIGNDGSQGLWETTTPAVSEQVISVASSQNEYFVGGKFHVGPESYSFAGLLMNIPSAPILLTVLNDTLCQSQLNQHHGIVLVNRGNCTVAQKARQAHTMGFEILMVANDSNDLFQFALEPSSDGIPAIGLSQQDAQKLALKSPVNVTFSPSLSIQKSMHGGMLSDFSSVIMI